MDGDDGDHLYGMSGGDLLFGQGGDDVVQAGAGQGGLCPEDGQPRVRKGYMCEPHGRESNRCRDPAGVRGYRLSSRGQYSVPPSGTVIER